jgi:predicted SAM-dependent methyltransferase
VHPVTEAIPGRLHLGCGLTTPAGWLNVDGSLQVELARRPWLKKLLTCARILPRAQAEIPWSGTVVRLNLNRPLPFPAERFSAVYSSHLLEHLYHDQALALLKECHRVLRRGSVCRAVVPDLEALASRYLRAKTAGDPEAATRLMEGLMVHDKGAKRGLLGAYYRMTAFHQHKWMYDAASLKRLFEAAGFVAVRQAGYLDSRIERIGEVEVAGRILDGEGLAVEGMKE